MGSMFRIEAGNLKFDGQFVAKPVHPAVVEHQATLGEKFQNAGHRTRVGIRCNGKISDFARRGC